MSVTETWLTRECSTAFVDIPNFNFFRGDTAGNVRKHGAGLYVSKSLAALLLDVPLPNIVVVYIPELDIHVVSVYRPPSYGPDENESLARFLVEFSLGKELLIMGDFNLPSLQWGNGEVSCSGYMTPTDRLFRDCFTGCGLTQFVEEGTFFPSGNTLDLMLCTDADRVLEVDCLPPLPRCAHCPVVASMVFQFRPDDVIDERYAWSRGDYDAFSTALFDVDWELLFEGSSAGECYMEFCRTIWELVPEFVPKQVPKSNDRWLARPPRSLRRRRKELWQCFKQMRRELGRRHEHTRQAWESYMSVNMAYRNYALNHQASYEERLVELLKVAPKTFHSYLRSRKTGCPSVGPLRDTDGQLVADQRQMGDLFADAFASVYIADIPQNPSEYQQTASVMEQFHVDYDLVLKKLLELNSSSSPGPDGIHPKVLKECAQVIVLPLCLIFRKSYDEGIVPAEWKISRVVPIFKGGSKALALNYRPVNLTSSPCKVMERLLVEHIVEYLETNNLLAHFQFGYRQGRSVEDQLLLMYGEVIEKVEAGGVVDVVYMDLSKAFELVNHVVLLGKLSALGFCRTILRWIEAFLVGRSMFVSVGTGNSDIKSVQSGVPQGSVLGPLLFLVYVNGLATGIRTKWWAFVDDYKIYSTGSPRNGLDEDLQSDLNIFSTRATSWNLKMNPEKCVVMRFGAGGVDADGNRYMLNGESLRFVTSHRDLGIVVDPSLRFHLHVSKLVGKTKGLINQLLRGTVCRSRKFMVTLFIAHIRPLMDFSARLWNVGYLGDIRSLEQVQKSWMGQISGMEDEEYGECIKQLGVHSVYGRLLRGDLIKVWQTFHSPNDLGLKGLLDVQSHSATRTNGFKLAIPRCRTELRRRFWSVRCVQRWNSLPPEVVQARTVECFKRRLDNHVGDLFFSTVGDN